ncbi:central spike [Synechococcus phage S-CREM2]|nr:central spike [Synechococcus phage S-CREM2]
MPNATRIGDADIPHCSGMVRAEGSPNVFVNKIPWSRQSDVNTPHLLPGEPCPIHAASIAIGSITVRVNGLGAGRIGDAISGCTKVAAGSINVFAGPGTDSPTPMAKPSTSPTDG